MTDEQKARLRDEYWRAAAVLAGHPQNFKDIATARATMRRIAREIERGLNDDDTRHD